jgi:hypothetical protein
MWFSQDISREMAGDSVYQEQMVKRVDFLKAFFRKSEKQRS